MNYPAKLYKRHEPAAIHHRYGTVPALQVILQTYSQHQGNIITSRCTHYDLLYSTINGAV